MFKDIFEENKTHIMEFLVKKQLIRAVHPRTS